MENNQKFLLGKEQALLFTLLLAALVAGCVTVTVETSEECKNKDATGNGPPGCTFSMVASGTAVPAGAVPINCQAGQPCAVPANATCGNSSNVCNNPGTEKCQFTKVCKDTYNMVSTQCMCQCR